MAWTVILGGSSLGPDSNRPVRSSTEQKAVEGLDSNVGDDCPTRPAEHKELSAPEVIDSDVPVQGLVLWLAHVTLLGLVDAFVDVVAALDVAVADNDE